MLLLKMSNFLLAQKTFCLIKRVLFLPLEIYEVFYDTKQDVKMRFKKLKNTHNQRFFSMQLGEIIC